MAHLVVWEAVIQSHAGFGRAVTRWAESSSLVGSRGVPQVSCSHRRIAREIRAEAVRNQGPELRCHLDFFLRQVGGRIWSVCVGTSAPFFSRTLLLCGEAIFRGIIII